MIEFTRELVAIPSPNPPGDERAVAEFASARLRELGITDIEVVGVSPERPNVLARVNGLGERPTLLLSGHLDTKPPGEEDEWRTEPWDPVIHDGVLSGLGSADMKGAVAAMVYAAAAIGHVGVPGTLALALTADEEAGGLHGAGWLAREGHLRADAAVIGEPSGITVDWEAIRLVSRGVAIFEIAVEGTQMHSSLSDRLDSVNANVQMARVMDRMDQEGLSILRFDPHPLVSTGPTLNVGLVTTGGFGFGIVPSEARFISDVRALPGMSRESIEADIRRFLERAAADDPDLRWDFSMLHWLPPCEVPADHPIVAALVAAAEHVLDQAPRLDAFTGGTDAPYFQLDAGIPTVPSFGPGLLTQAHAPNESIAVDSIVQAARMYAHAALQYLHGDGHR